MGDALDDDIEAYDMEADAEGLQGDEVRKPSGNTERPAAHDYPNRPVLIYTNFLPLV